MTQLAWNLALRGHSKSQALIAEQVVVEEPSKSQALIAEQVVLEEPVAFAHQNSLLQMDWHQDRRCLKPLLAHVLPVVAHAPHQPSKWTNAW